LIKILVFASPANLQGFGNPIGSAKPLGYLILI
jgi:hypothetical protein